MEEPITVAITRGKNGQGVLVNNWLLKIKLDFGFYFVQSWPVYVSLKFGQYYLPRLHLSKPGCQFRCRIISIYLSNNLVDY